jgi:hypothetical protein
LVASLEMPPEVRRQVGAIVELDEPEREIGGRGGRVGARQ